MADIKIKRCDITSDATYIKRTIMVIINNFMPKKYNDLDERDNFLELQKLSKLPQEEINNLNSPIYLGK